MPKKNAHAMGEPLMSLTGRFPVSVVARIDAHAEAMRCAMPGLSIGRTDVLRSLVVQALDALYGPTAGAVPDTVTDTSPLWLQLQQEIRALKAGTVTDTSPLWRMVEQDFEAFLDSRTALLKSLRRAQPVTDTPAQAEAVGTAPVAGRVTDTVTDTESVTDTVTVTGQAREPFDTTRYYLGKLCPHGHDFEGTGHSLRRQHNMTCRECQNESRREKRQAKHQAAPAD